MNFLSRDASGDQLPIESFENRPESKVDDDGLLTYVLGDDSLIEYSMSMVHKKYRIPESEHDELGRLIFGYQRARKRFEKAFGYWKTSRGKHMFELEFVLMEEETELFSFWHFVNAYELAVKSLREFLEEQETHKSRILPLPSHPRL